MFQANDMVLYCPHGVCQISEISKQSFGGKTAEYYILKPIQDERSTIYVPMENQALTKKMRRLLSAAEICSLIEAMPMEETFWIEEETVRKARYREILVGGQREELVSVIKSIYLHRKKLQEQGKKLHLVDERFFKDAESMLYDEFAYVLQIDREEVMPFIMEKLNQKGMTLYEPAGESVQ